MAPTRLDHIAIALPSIAQAPGIVAGLLGGIPDKTRPSTVFRWATWLFEGGGCLEVLEPTGPDGFLHRFLAGHGPGVHHVTFKVPDLDKACRAARELGHDVVGRDDSDPSWKEAFLHPRQAQGIVVQMVEAGVCCEPNTTSAVVDDIAQTGSAQSRLAHRIRDEPVTVPVVAGESTRVGCDPQPTVPVGA